MGKIGKLLVFLLLLILATVIAFSAFIHFYLTEDRLKAMLIPPAEKALGRRVTIAGIQAGLFTGVKVKGLAVKELDGQQDFAAVDTAVLSYDLWKLLQKQLAISEITLRRPRINIFRDRQGKFNYETLAVLQPQPKKTTSPATEPNKKNSPALPLAVTVAAIQLQGANFTFTDQRQQLPAVTGQADLKITSLRLGKTPAAWRYQGVLDLKVTAKQGQLQPRLAGRVKFDQQQLSYDLTITQEKEKLQVSGQVSDYFTGPTVIANLSSQALRLDYLASLAGAAGPAAAKNDRQSKPTAKPKAAGSSPAAGLPPKLVVKGKITIGQASYRELKIDDFQADYLFKNRILNINGLQGRLAAGLFTGQATVNLQQADPAYEGGLSLTNIQVNELLAMTAPAAAKMITGTLASKWTFAGRGTDSEMIKRHLSADGTYVIKDGRLQDIPATAMIASLLNLPSLEKIEFSTIDGNFHLRQGKIQLKSTMNAAELSARSTGTVGLDGRLQLPVNLTLGRELSRQLVRKYPWMKNLADREGRTTIDLQVNGSLSRPRVALNEKTTQKQVEKVIEKKLFEQLNRSLQKK
ncbi:MAG: AsmA family protein [Deltaproteobacteria bacterium]|nr:AsmA family protein [Deltaproteobacteria bacterium]